VEPFSCSFSSIPLKLPGALCLNPPLCSPYFFRIFNNLGLVFFCSYFSSPLSLFDIGRLADHPTDTSLSAPHLQAKAVYVCFDSTPFDWLPKMSRPSGQFFPQQWLKPNRFEASFTGLPISIVKALFELSSWPVGTAPQQIFF